MNAPPALARRLAQVGIAAAAEAAACQAALAQGQRLVSPDGGLWRWDGLVRPPEAQAATATRLRQQQRRRALEGLLQAARTQLAGQERAAAEAEAEAADAAGRRQQAATARAAAQSAFETLRETLVQARAADAALAAELGALAREQTALAAETRELEGLRAPLAQEAGAAPAEQPDAEAAEAARTEALARDRQAEAALGATRGRLAAARAAVATQRQRVQGRATAAREGELERARIEARLDELAQELGRLEAAGPELAAAAGRSRDGARGRARSGSPRPSGPAPPRARPTPRPAMREGRLRDRLAAAQARRAALEQELASWSERRAAAEARLAELEQRRRELAGELARLAELPATVARQQQELAARQSAAEARQSALREQLAAAETGARRGRGGARAHRGRCGSRRARRRRGWKRASSRPRPRRRAPTEMLRARLGALPEDAEQSAPDGAALAELESELARLGAARERLGPVNLRAIDEAAELALRIETMEAEQAELAGAIERLRRAIATLNREGRERLRAAFAKVERHFEALFTRLFGGGRARLALTDQDDPFAAGLELAASPPGKKLQSVSLLSGGEKALTALALIFAVFLTKPAPLCVLDEVDAPLDDANVERLMALLEELAEGTRTRFLVVTHHPLTMARMHRLYGVTMAERGISQLVSVDLTSAIELRATA